MAGLRSALRSIERRGPPTALVDAAAARFGPVDGWAGLIEGHDHPAQLAAGFAPDIAAAAAMAGDAVAAGLIEQAAALLAESVAAAAGRIGGAGPIRFAAVGGLLGLGAGFVEALLARVRAAAPRLDFEAAAGSALDGARLLALDRGTIHEPRVIRAAASAGAAAAGLDLLATEGVRPGLDDLDERPPSAIVHLVLQSERAAQEALARAEPSLAAAAEGVAERMRLGGRLFTLGAGTPGRLAVLDAAELGPTFSAPPELVVALLAGGMAAMVVAVEGAEDDAEAAGRSLAEHGLSAGDAVVGITASGRTPYVVGGLRAARAVGALTVAIVNNAGGPAAGAAEMAVQILTGPELVAGSTRMSAGTTQKIALNAISTAAMIALGKTYGARMVDVRASNEKLRRRALRMVREITGAAEPEAAAALAAAGGRVKPAIVALLGGVGPAQAEALLDAAGGRARAAIAAAKA
jgi:N-acetylmuramic acid 6-phosphate etherase